MIQVFSTPQKATAYAKAKNKNARLYKYVTLVYPKSSGGNGKKILVKKVKK
jgi:hypothetical protein